MSQRARPRLLLFALILLCLLGLYPIQERINAQLAPRHGQHEELTFMPTESRISNLAGGYSGLLAAIYWTRAVQYYGRHRLARASDFALLGTLLDTTTRLDPHLLVAYRFGSLFLAGKKPEGAGDPQRAIYLLERGIVANPDYWRLWEDLGFIYYWDMKDYDHAARAFRAGSERPGALPWMRVLAASVAAEGGQIQNSRILWSEIARTAGVEQIRRTAQLHLVVLDTQETLNRLNSLVAVYRQKQGRDPRSLEDLMTAGMLRAIPVDPSGEKFVLGPDGKASVGPNSRVEMELGD